MNVHFIWTTADDTFLWRHQVSVESVLFHHPEARVRVHSNTLDPGRFEESREAGLDIQVVPYDLHEAVSGSPCTAWVDAIERWQNGPHFYSHVTELLRFALLFREGGVYLDTDVIVLNPIDDLRNTLGIEELQADGSPAMLNCAVMAFDREHPFLRACLEEFLSGYRMERWAWNGPMLVTRTHRWSGAGVTLQPVQVFYPIHWRDIARYFRADDLPGQDSLWARLRESSRTLHWWNKCAADLEPRPGSLMSRAFHEFRPTGRVTRPRSRT